MEIPKKYILFSFVVLMIYALALNEWNIHAIRKQNPTNKTSNNRSLVHNSTVYSVDNEWYVSQIKNFVKGYGFTIDPAQYHYNVRRSPVYPMFYGIHYLLFGEEGSYFFIRFTQIFIFCLSAIALFFAAFNFTGDKKIALLAAVIYGFNPTTVSFLYFTITESLSPALVCFLLYSLSLCKKYNRSRDWILAGVCFAVASLCRPPVFFLSLSILLLALFVNRNFRVFFKHGFAFLLGAVLLFIPYVIRNYIVTDGELIILERYYRDPMQYGMPNMELRKWISCWTNPADYSSENISNEMINAICCEPQRTRQMVIDDEMKKLPPRATLANSTAEIRAAYESLYDYYQIRYSHAPAIHEAEDTCMQKLGKIREDFRHRAPFQYYFVTPVLIIKSVVVQSNSAPVAFLDNYTGNPFKIILKSFLLLLNVCMFVSLLFFMKRFTEIYFITLLYTAGNFAYIVFYVKYFEARYLLPLFPCLAITCGIFLLESFGWMRKRLHF